MFELFAAGALTGVVHVFGGPDHLAALAPLAVRRGPGAWSMGLGWGLGHAVGTLAVGALALVTRNIVALEHLSRASESLVGLVLIAVGVWGWHRSTSIARRAGSDELATFAPSRARPLTTAVVRQARSSLPIGALHALAGGSHLLAILPAVAMSRTAHAVGYLSAFCAGSIVAMMSWTHVLGFASQRVSGERAAHAVLRAASGMAIVCGLVWLACA